MANGIQPDAKQLALFFPGVRIPRRLIFSSMKFIWFALKIVLPLPLLRNTGG